MLWERHWQSGQSASGEVVSTTVRMNCSSASRRTRCRPEASGNNVGLVGRAMVDSISEGTQQSFLMASQQAPLSSKVRETHPPWRGFKPQFITYKESTFTFVGSIVIASLYCGMALLFFAFYLATKKRRESRESMNAPVLLSPLHTCALLLYNASQENSGCQTYHIFQRIHK